MFHWLRPGLRPALVGIGAAFIVVLTLGITPATAQASLTSSSPAPGAVVGAVPAQVVLTFDEAVRPVPDQVHVLDPNGRRVDIASPSGRGLNLRISLHPSEVRGTYVVEYAVLSSDNHRIGSAFTFVVRSRGTTGASVAGFTDTSGRWSNAALPLVRWIGYLGLSVLVGAALMLGSLWPRRGDRFRASRVMWAGAILVAGATMIELGLQLLIAADGGAVRWSDVRDFFTSRSGVMHEARLALLLALAGVLGSIARGTAGRVPRTAAALLLTAEMMTYALAGHPGETPAPVISVLSDGLHLGAMSVWLGGLILLVTFVLPRADDDELGTIVPLWSAWAGYAVFTLLLTGIAQSILQIGTVTLLLDTGYGRLVLAKAGLLAVVLLIALGSRRLAAAMGQRVTGGARRLRRLVAAESVGILVVLAVTAVLVQTPPARAAEAARAANSVTTLRMTGRLGDVTLTVDPGRRGPNRLDLRAVAADGTPLPIKVWSGTASQPDRGIEGVDLGLLALTPDHAVGLVKLPTRGAWRLTITLVDAELRSATLTTQLTVT